MAQRIVKDDRVKIISGAHKGTVAKVVAVVPEGVLLEGIGQKHRHFKANQLNPRGGHKDIHVPVPIHKVALVVDEKSGKTSRIGYAKNADGDKIRIARQANNKEIK